MGFLASLFGNLGQIEADATEIHVTDAFTEVLGLSHGELASVLRNALKAGYPGEQTYVWTRDVYDDSVVYEVTTGSAETPTLYQRDYALVDGEVTLGDPVEVIPVMDYIPVSESEPVTEAISGIVAWMRKHGGAHPHSACVAKFGDASMCAKAKDIMTGTTKWRGGKSKESDPGDEITGELVPLVEASVKEDGTAQIKIIAPGQGSSGYYPADVLQRDGPKVFGAGTHIYLDHPSISEESNRPERSVKDLAGALTGPAEWKDDGLYAPVKFIDSVAPHINAIASISGMSIRASGTTGTREVDGKKVRSIESIDVAHSIDVVTRAGAGGKVMDLIESARKGVSIGTTEDGDDMDKEALEEAQRKIADLEDKIAAQEAREQEARLLADARAVVATTLAGIANLPTLTRERLTESLSANPPATDGALDREALKAKVTEAAAAELAYLASVTGGNPVRGMGSTEQPATPTIPTLEESDKRIAAALAAL